MIHEHGLDIINPLMNIYMIDDLNTSAGRSLVLHLTGTISV